MQLENHEFKIILIGNCRIHTVLERAGMDLGMVTNFQNNEGQECKLLEGSRGILTP